MFAGPYAKYYTQLNRDKPYRKEIEFVYRWGGRPGTILDIGCGDAQYWKYFPDDIDISGRERSEDFIKMSPHRDVISQGDIIEDKYDPMINYDLVTALFDVINYIPQHSWWKFLPLSYDGYFIFDVWDKKKVDRDGFRETFKRSGDVFRRIVPISYKDGVVELKLEFGPVTVCHREFHKMYVFSRKQIENFAKPDFEIVDIRETKHWQTWYKLRKK